MPADEVGSPMLTGDDQGRPGWAGGSGVLDIGTLVFTTDYLKYDDGVWTREPHPANVGQELGTMTVQAMTHLPGSNTTLSVGSIAYYHPNSQYVPRIERTEVP